MNRLWGDLGIAAVALAASIAVLVALPVDVPGTGLQTLTDMASAAFFPMLAALLVGLSAAVLAVSALATRRSGAAEPIPPVGARPLIMIAAFVAYIPLIHWLGMITASAIVVAVLPLVYGYRDPRWILPLAVILPAAVYVLFERVLKVLFPHGVLF